MRGAISLGEAGGYVGGDETEHHYVSEEMLTEFDEPCGDTPADLETSEEPSDDLEMNETLVEAIRRLHRHHRGLSCH
jgi:hypothetical protein